MKGSGVGMASGAGVGVVGADGAVGTYQGSRFRDVRAQLLSDPYQVLPPGRTRIGDEFKAWKNLLFSDSITRVDTQDDLVPPHPKLLHSVGICMFGRWTITEDTGYTGCFRRGADHLIVVRCSTLLSHTDRGTRRGFGLAGKIFPTVDPDELVKTGNFICIDNLGGTFADRFADVALTNEPPLGVNPGLIPFAFVVLNVVYCFQRADSVPQYRPIAPLSERGLAPGETPKAPKWLQVAVEDGTVKCDAVDFRDELRVVNYKDRRLRFSISVASETSPAGERLFRRVGTIEVTEDVCSVSADQRLRFQHTPNRGHTPA